MNLRPCVSDEIQNPNVVSFQEKGFQACHGTYLECILRQSRTTGTDFRWDITSKLAGVAHARQLAVDALFYIRNVGINTNNGFGLFKKLMKKFGLSAADLLPNVCDVSDENAPGGAAMKSLDSSNAFYVWAEFPDGKRKGRQFEGESDMTTLKAEKF